MRAVESNRSEGPTPVSNPVSGAAMDRPVTRQRFPAARVLGVLTVLLVAGGLGYLLLEQTGSRTLTIENSRLVISPVTSGVFEDFIPIRGRVTPLSTVYLDMIEGGQVETRLVDDGAMVEAGDLIVVLNNTSLQLDVTRNEAMVTEQLNNMRSIELQLEQNRLAHKRNLVEIDYQITRLGRQVERLENLDTAGVAAKSQLEDARDELDYFRNRRAVTLESQATDARLQETQLEFLKTSATQLEDNLSLSRRNLDALNVRAPVSGKLSGLDVEVGQSIQRGGRLGQIDDPDNFKLRVAVDEYYLSRVDLGQSALVDRGRDTYALTVSKIYPQVKDGQFEIDLTFDGEQPADIRRGQTLQATLTLGDATEALLIPNGAFFQDTGGNWMFVVTDNSTEAVRRNVVLGRRNSRYIEVLEGLEAGEEVITSPYSSFREMDRLSLSEG
ncbi:MAG: efflux RND transporter periplasmic adaptor subunit [Pseudomonadota bacterium]